MWGGIQSGSVSGDLCKNEEIVVLSSRPATVDFGDWLTKEIVTGPLTISLGGYNADLPVIVDNVTVGNHPRVSR